MNDDGNFDIEEHDAGFRDGLSGKQLLTGMSQSFTQGFVAGLAKRIEQILFGDSEDVVDHVDDT